ncbi:retrovirus-related pol polyprotein from transposon TNT 1-94 [Tanacetum coccineum]|uniref:Retrovirus-related pol polyprotein from transposon TNT 1-94 n=1 Tax=Tanacetum coccineum TaxID=301880 RepID=A0ABQ5F1K5_9ASTR
MSNSFSMSKGFQPKFTPKFIQSSQQSSQNEPKIQKNDKAEYKKMKAKLALLKASPSTSQSPKPFQSKNKGLVGKTFNWDVEEVSDDEEMKQVKVLMALVDDKLDVGKNHAHNDEWIDITIRKVSILLSMVEDADCEQIPNQKKKILRGEQRTKLSSKNDVKENPFIPTSLDYDHEMVPKFKDWVEIYNPDNKLPNFNTDRILGASPARGTITVCDTEPTTSLVPTKVKNNYQESKIDELTKLVQMLIDEKINSTQKIQESKSMNPQSESSKSVNSSKPSQESKPNGHNSVIQVRGEVLAESSQSSESSIDVCCTTCGSNVHLTTDHNDFEHFKRGDKIQATKAREPTKRIKHVHHVKKESIRELHSKQKNFSIRKCLHLLHMDLTGPVSSMSINHEKYTLVVVDEYSRYTWVHFPRKKSQAAEMIMSFIRMNFSSLYTPEQNGVAERKNRTLIEAARTMLNGLVLSKHFWTEAFRIACYTQNRLITVKRHDKTPNDIFRE